MKLWLKHPLSWGAVILAAIVTVTMTFAYLGAFIDPTTNVRGLPLVVVNADRPVTVGGRQVALGSELVRRLRATTDTRIRWTFVTSRQAAVDLIRDDQAYGGLVIPPAFSGRISALADPRRVPVTRAELEVLRNPASGSIASLTADAFIGRVVGAETRAVRAAILPSWRAGALRSVRVGMLLARPVAVSQTVVQPIGTHAARGLAPFYFAVMVTLAGLLGANIVSLAVEIVAGNVRLDIPGLRELVGSMTLSTADRWRWKTYLTVAMAVPSAVLQTWMAVGVLGMPTASGPELALFSLVGILAVALATLFFLTVLGTAGALPALLFTTIFGVPSAGGVYPLQMLPGFFRFLGAWLPLRYITDGTRALTLFDGRITAGLGMALIVLAAYASVSLALSALWVRVIGRTGDLSIAAPDIVASHSQQQSA